MGSVNLDLIRSFFVPLFPLYLANVGSKKFVLQKLEAWNITFHIREWLIRSSFEFFLPLL